MTGTPLTNVKVILNESEESYHSIDSNRLSQRNIAQIHNGEFTKFLHHHPCNIKYRQKQEDNQKLSFHNRNQAMLVGTILHEMILSNDKPLLSSHYASDSEYEIGKHAIKTISDYKEFFRSQNIEVIGNKTLKATFENKLAEVLLDDKYSDLRDSIITPEHYDVSRKFEYPADNVCDVIPTDTYLLVDNVLNKWRECIGRGTTFWDKSADNEKLYEVTVYADLYGVPIKCRVDLLDVFHGVVDLKTYASGNKPSGYAKQTIYDYGYIFQINFYRFIIGEVFKLSKEQYELIGTDEQLKNFLYIKAFHICNADIDKDGNKLPVVDAKIIMLDKDIVGGICLYDVANTKPNYAKLTADIKMMFDSYKVDFSQPFEFNGYADSQATVGAE